MGAVCPRRAARPQSARRCQQRCGPAYLRDQETRIAFPAVFGRIGLTDATRVETFYQLHFERTASNECGTFFSSLDFMSDGCDKAMFGQPLRPVRARDR